MDVKRRRLELPRHNCHYPLKVARLPIPPSLQLIRKSKNCFLCIQNLCPEQDSNLHASRHTHLKRARLPIPPPGHCLFRMYTSELILNVKDQCPKQDSNLHASRHTHLKRARLPIPPLGLHHLNLSKKHWSGKRDSNSRPRPWQGRALPTELLPPLRFAVAKVGIFFKLASVESVFFLPILQFLSRRNKSVLKISPFCPGSPRKKIGGAPVRGQPLSRNRWRDGGYR